ncbi:uncharacterized protein LOC131666379 [Phymastichus coffea]|uniref:uncharacterized protein LOC131666379 n=1 Tax=Phymastichus coffea TaxID=108790 RepID=UPI00273CDA7E|nr:uncharacterized protein LOC131666379 [Phymastichus coffea]
MNIARTYLVRYVHQDWPFRTCFIFRNPQPKNIKIKEMFRPLADSVWLLMLILMSLSVVTLAFMARYEWLDFELMRWSSCFLLVVGTLCQQGTTARINNISTRIAFFSILTFAFLIYTYYSAGVVSARLNEPIQKINDSLSELAKLPLRFSSEYMVYFDFFMKRPEWETATFYAKTWLPLPEEQRFMDPESAMRFVKEGGFAYHTHPDVAYPIVDRFYSNREICELTEVHLARPTRSTFAVALNSTIVEIVRVGLTKISEVGLRARQISRWQYRKPRCRKDVLSASSVTVYEFSPHLLLLLIGYLIALATCIMEIYIANRNARDVQSTNGTTSNLRFDV